MKPTLLALLLTAVAALSVAAQPEPRAWRDSLAALTDTAALRRMADADARSVAPLDQLRRGFAALRLYELTRGREAAEQARAAFERARDLAPGHVFADLGIGLSLAALADAQDADAPTIVAGLAFAEALGIDARSRARRALQRALEAEPALAEAAAALAGVALRTREPETLRAAHTALTRVTRGPAASAGSWLARARVALALGDPADALAAADAALAIGGPLRPQALHARGIALLRTDGRAQEGARAYFEAVRTMTSAAAKDLRDELLELTAADERSHLDTLAAAERAAYLEEFWDVRAGLAGVPRAERLAEHHRRLALAFERYRRQARWGAVPTNALLRARPEGRFDDRGLLLVRHGEPLDVVRTAERDMPGNESWLYVNAAGAPFMVHFVEYADFSDYVLIYDVPCSSGWVADRLGYDPRMNVLHHRCTASSQRSVSYEIRREVYDALATDSDRPTFDADLAFAYDLHTFRGPGGETDVVLSAAAAGEGFRETANSAGEPLRALRLSLAVVDTVAGTVVRGETLAPITGDSVRAHVAVSAAPAREAVARVTARDAGNDAAGRLRGRGLRIHSYRGDTLMVSDIVLASPAAPAPGEPAWTRGDVRLMPAPQAVFDAGGFRVFAEVYNLPAGEPYETELRVERTDGGIIGAVRRLFGGRTSVRLRFEEHASPDADGVVRLLRTVRADLAPGRYVLALRVARPDGVVVERARTFRIAAAR